MWNLVLEQVTAVQAFVSLLTAFVWIVYLHMFVSGMRRQRRTEILITLGGDWGLDGRIIISNLGLEPIYILDVLLKNCAGGNETVISIADRAELHPSDRPSLELATLQRPLKSGEHIEIGSLDELLERASRRGAFKRNDSELTHIEITVAAVTAAASSIVGARRIFQVRRDDGLVQMRPTTLWAEQIRGGRGRRDIARQLTRNL